MHSCSGLQDERLDCEKGEKMRAWKHVISSAMAGRDPSHLLEGLTTTETGHPGLTGSSDELNVNVVLQVSPATAGWEVFDMRGGRTSGVGGVSSGINHKEVTTTTSEG